MNRTEVSPGFVCTLEQWNEMAMGNYFSNSNPSLNPPMHCLSPGDRVGLTIVAEAGLVSLAAVSYVFILILRNILWRIRHTPKNKMRVFHHPMELLMFSLFSADVLQAIGGVMDLKWIQQGRVETGHFCNAQGIVQQLGETGVAVATLLIAVFTFINIWTASACSMALTSIVIGGTWSIVIILVIAGNLVNPDFQTPTPYWCWISPAYTRWRQGGEYAWFWVTMCFLFISYTLLYFWSRGNIVTNQQSWWSPTFRRTSKLADSATRAYRRQSYSMLAYPFVYCVTIIPVSIVRWFSFSHPHAQIPSSATFAAASIFCLSGFFNVILLLNTRPNVKLFDRKSGISLDALPSPPSSA